MDHTYWHRQKAGEPLFPDLLWSRPENRAQAGKLLVVGGNAHGFAAAGEAFAMAMKAGSGTVRVLLPDSLQKTVGRVFEAGEYAPSTPSGSFSKLSLASLIEMSAWADGVLLSGDMGRNSETAVLLEAFASKYSGKLVITQDSLDYFIKSPKSLLNRPSTTLVASFAQLQKIGTNSSYYKAFTFEMDFLKLVETLHDFTTKYPVTIVVKHLKDIFVASAGQVSSTRLEQDQEIWRVNTAARVSVWQIQNPTKIFEATTSALVSE